ncbi:hypothetical protein DICA1_C10726 [Diutina catenulata]
MSLEQSVLPSLHIFANEEEAREFYEGVLEHKVKQAKSDTDYRIDFIMSAIAQFRLKKVSLTRLAKRLGVGRTALTRWMKREEYYYYFYCEYLNWLEQLEDFGGFASARTADLNQAPPEFRVYVVWSYVNDGCRSFVNTARDIGCDEAYVIQCVNDLNDNLLSYRVNQLTNNT